MKVKVVKGTLPNRDADLAALKPEMISETELENYQRRAKLILAPQKGHYKSVAGATITPLPLWAVNLQVGRRRIGEAYQVIPVTQDGLHLVGTPPWASEVAGPGAEKEKWRGKSFDRPADPSNLFAVVTSSWLVPFAIVHRYLAHLPAEVSNSHIIVRKDHVTQSSRLGKWVSGEDAKERHLKHWVELAQKVWVEGKRGEKLPYITDRLDRQRGLSEQPARAVRVVHTRSRSLYAAVLNPAQTTALGLPLGEAIVHTREDGRVIQTVRLPLAGTICDNLLHWIAVPEPNEAYWLVGLFNSPTFNAIVMNEAQGEPPGIYSLPAKVMDGYGLVYDVHNPGHRLISETAKELELGMRKTALEYFSSKKAIDLELLDDTTESQDVPLAVSSAMMRRLGAVDMLTRLDAAVRGLLADSV